MVGETETNRPYTPPSNVISVLERVRSRNLPERIDLEYLRDAGIPEGTLHRTFFALRFLKLVEEAGDLTGALKAIGTSTDEEYRAILSGLIREAYAEVFNAIDPAEDSQEQILNVFRRYTPASQRKRMVIFFLGMCREAGIPALDVPRQRGMGRPRGRAETPTPRTKTGKASLEGGAAVRARGSLRSPDIAPALEGLVRSLPAPGTPLSAERREQWVNMARATLAFVYPEETTSAATTEEEQDDGE
jgi:hypothetical protein